MREQGSDRKVAAHYGTTMRQVRNLRGVYGVYASQYLRAVPGPKPTLIPTSWDEYIGNSMPNQGIAKLCEQAIAKLYKGQRYDDRS